MSWKQHISTQGTKVQQVRHYFVSDYQKYSPYRGAYTYSQSERLYCVTDKLRKLRSFDRQWRRPNDCVSSPLLHRELRNSLWESYSFLSLPADTTMASFRKARNLPK
jgi:hypothetical protein